MGGIFWLMAALALVGIAITTFVVPKPRRLRVHREAETVPALLGSTLRNPELLRLDFGIFALHAMLTASFLVVPELLREVLGMSSRDQWLVYLPVLLASVAIMVPAIIIAERHRRMKAVLVGAIGALAASQLLLAMDGHDVVVLITAITIFFAGFNIMEASLPSLVTKTAPSGSTGTATGIYSSSQFLGIFVGGVAGGWVDQADGTVGVFILACALAVLWLPVACTMRRPSHFTTRVVRVGDRSAADADRLAARLRQVPGVAEALVVPGEGLAYLKVDSKIFDRAKAESVAGATLEPV
jgi:predicted MFS family arabinose efflux permease